MKPHKGRVLETVSDEELLELINYVACPECGKGNLSNVEGIITCDNCGFTDKIRKLCLCPQCGKQYYSSLGVIPGSRNAVQKDYPHAQPWEREQLITGICSDDCWVQYFC
jgi:hypothetical protein